MISRNRSLLLAGIAACLLLLAGGWALLSDSGASQRSTNPTRGEPPRPASAGPASEGGPELPGRNDSTASVRTDEADRIALPESALAGEILDPSGQPVRAAVVSWTPMLEDQRSADQRLGDLDFDRIRTSTVFATTDAVGRFTFEAPPPDLDGSASVVWISHPSWQAASVILPAEWKAWIWPSELELQPGESVPVEVVSGAGDPCPAAVVLQRMVFTGPHPELTEEEIDARRFFWRELDTGADGKVHAHPGQGRTHFIATKDERVSAPWMGVPEAPVTLTLLASFLVSGEVRTGEQACSFSGARVTLGFGDGTDTSDVAWSQTSMQVRADGGFGPATYPLPSGAYLHSWISGGDVIGQYDSRLAPRPGEPIRLVLDVSIGVRVPIHVEDVEGRPIEGATVWGYPLRHDDFVDVGCKALTDAEGLALVRGLPPGRTAFRAGKEGYAMVDRWMDPPPAPQLVLPSSDDEELRITLPPSATVKGVVVHDGEPVPEFEVIYWTGYDVAGHMPFSDEEGRFEVVVEEGVEVSLTASVEELPQSETVTVTAGEDETEVVELVIPEPRICRGQVIDAVTGEPHLTARLVPWTTTGRALFRRRGDSYSTDGDGRFEIPGFYPGRGGLEITAEGYTSIYTTVHSDHGEIIEYGIVALEPLASAMIRVAGWQGEFDRCLVWQNQSKPNAPVPLDADGTKRLESLRPANYTFFLRLPDGTVHTTKHRVLPAQEAEVTFRLGGDAELEVTVELEDGRHELNELRVRASFRGAAGTPRTEEVEVPESGKCVLGGLRAGPSVVELLDATGRSLCSRPVELLPGTRVRARLGSGAKERRLRLLDGDGAPCSTVNVQLALPGDRSGWCPLHWTDVEGELELGALEATSVLLFTKLSSSHLAYGVRVELDPDPSRVTEVRLEARAPLILLLLEEGSPRSGVSMTITHPALPAGHLGVSAHSDERGFVRGYLATEGTYLVTPDSPRYWPNTTAVDVFAGKEPYSIELYGRGTMRWRALSSTGTPVAGVGLELSHSALGGRVLGWIETGAVTSSTGELVTDSNGELELTGLPRGDYEWSARYPDGTVLHGVEHLPPGKPIAVEIRP